MFTIPMTRYIANAAARFSGRNGAVTRQAQIQGCSRQTVYNHASEVVEAIQVEHSDGPSREQLLRENQELRRENNQLWDWLNLLLAPLVVPTILLPALLKWVSGNAARRAS